jgi:hypothetical protein
MDYNTFLKVSEIICNNSGIEKRFIFFVKGMGFLKKH